MPWPGVDPESPYVVRPRGLAYHAGIMGAVRRTNYDRAASEAYVQGRGFTEKTMAAWIAVMRKYAPVGEGPRILDLGSGTGRFSAMLADTLGGEVLGVEPSDDMRTKAEQVSTHPRVSYVAGSGDRIPASAGAFDFAWLSMILHHLSDIGACAREVARVMRPGGRVVVRNSYSGRLQGVPFYEFFPAGLKVDEERLPRCDEVKRMFGEAGLGLHAEEGVLHVIDNSWGEHLERLKKRGVSTLTLISDEEFNEGVRQIGDAIASGKVTGAVTEKLDTVVFEKPAD